RAGRGLAIIHQRTSRRRGERVRRRCVRKRVAFFCEASWTRGICEKNRARNRREGRRGFPGERRTPSALRDSAAGRAWGAPTPSSPYKKRSADRRGREARGIPDSGREWKLPAKWNFLRAL